MSSSDDLNITLSGLLFYKVEKQPQPVGMYAVVYLLEEVETAFVGAKQSSPVCPWNAEGYHSEVL